MSRATSSPAHIATLLAALLAASLSAIGGTAVGADTAATLDQIRERARQIEETRQILADPDQTVRLAAFEALAGGDDAMLREMAIDAGLASTDQLLRGLALRHTVLGLAQLSLTLVADDAAPKPTVERSQAYLEKTGRGWLLVLDGKRSDLQTGRFGGSRSYETGDVSGLVLTFGYGHYSGELHLQDDNTLAGTVYYNTGQGDHQFKASAPLR